MPKIFYTERDIEDLFNSGVTSLVVNDDVVVTDLGRERAMKLGFDLVREFDQPPSAPVRPYITEKRSPSAATAGDRDCTQSGADQALRSQPNQPRLPRTLKRACLKP